MIRSRVKIKEGKNLLKDIKKYKCTADIGLLSDTESTIVTIGATQEFGTENAGKGRNITIPERSYLRSTYDEKKEHIESSINKAKPDILFSKMSKLQLIKRLALYLQSEVQKKITNSKEWAVANTENTLKRKYPYTRPLFAGEDSIKKHITFRIK